MMTRFFLVIWLIVGVGPLLADEDGQQKGSLQQRPVDLTVEDVVTLVQAGLDEGVIIEKLEQNGKVFDLTVDQLLELKAVGVKAGILKAMMNPGGDSAAVGTGTGQSERNSNWPAGIPEEVGIYARLDGKVTVLEPEIVTWKTGSMLKAIATSGIAGGNVNRRVRDAHSRLQVSLPFEVTIVCPAGGSGYDYQLLKLEVKKNHREFRLVTGGLFAKSGTDKNVVPVDPEKLASRVYRLDLTRLDPGEYGILPADSGGTLVANSLGKIYSFGIE